MGFSVVFSYMHSEYTDQIQWFLFHSPPDPFSPAPFPIPTRHCFTFSSMFLACFNMISVFTCVTEAHSIVVLCLASFI
jgi:hypothetical protein